MAICITALWGNHTIIFMLPLCGLCCAVGFTWLPINSSSLFLLRLCITDLLVAGCSMVHCSTALLLLWHLLGLLCCFAVWIAGQSHNHTVGNTCSEPSLEACCGKKTTSKVGIALQAIAFTYGCILNCGSFKDSFACLDLHKQHLHRLFFAGITDWDKSMSPTGPGE